MRKLRIVQVLEATSGGTRRHLLDLCRGLDPEQFELHAVLSPNRERQPGELAQLLAQLGISTFSLPMRRRPDLSDWQAIGKLTAYLRELQPDIVHCHSSKAGLVGRLAAWRAGIKQTLYTPHGFSFCMNVAWPLRWSFLQAERWLGRQTTGIIAVCESEREITIKARIAPTERVHIVQNGVMIPAQADQQTAMTPESKIILCVGGLRPQKGYDLLLRAMREVKAEVPEVRLVIAGAGPQRDMLEKLAQQEAPGAVTFLGECEDITELLAQAQVFCQPSRWEGCPYSVLEACVARRAIVGFAIPGITDVIKTGISGWLAPAGDIHALAGCLIEALQQQRECEIRAQHSFETVRDKFNMTQMIEGTAKLYRKLGQ